MALLVSIVRCTHVPSAAEVQDYAKAHRAVFGTCAEVPRFVPTPGKDDQMAIVGEVHDLAELRRISRTPEGDAMIRRFGFLEQLDFYVDEA